MEHFRTTIPPVLSTWKIGYKSPIIMIGSCFTEHFGQRFKSLGYPAIVNPMGTVYHPFPMARQLSRLLSNSPYQQEDLCINDGLWHSWDHSTLFSSEEPAAALEKMIVPNLESEHSPILFLTLGSSFGYELSSGLVVANCHKYPSSTFQKKMFGINEMTENLSNVCLDFLRKYDNGRIVLTVSPVRHLKDGFVENNRSKSRLLLVAENLASLNASISYFPAYEILMDDLRDYRFYESDKCHPSALAIGYVWDYFSNLYFEEETKIAHKKIADYQQMASHKPRNTSGESFTKWKNNLDRLQQELLKDYEFE
jgi:hypothetical protein